MSATTPLPRTLEEAEKWTWNWQSKYPNLSKAFLIPADDLIACFNEMGIKMGPDGRLQIDSSGNYAPCVRAYLAIEEHSSQEALLIVGTTTKDGEQYDDIIGTSDADSPINGSGIYDFTRPCPSNCDLSSPLYHKTKMVFSK